MFKSIINQVTGHEDPIQCAIRGFFVNKTTNGFGE